MDASTTASSSTASGCGCVDNRPLLLEKSNCENEETGEPGVLFHDACLPVSFGSGECRVHDLGVDPRCPNTTTDIPSFCTERWCYVDPDACRLSPELVYRSTMFKEIYYSYSVCNATAENYLQYQTTQSVRGVTLRVTIPVVRDLAHFKLTPEGRLAESGGPEYYDDNVPWQGWMVDYFDSVVELSDLEGVRYTYRTKGADTQGLGAFTGVVHDVQAGMTDLAMSTYWITSDRLQMTPYTTPVYVDQVHLWVPQPALKGGSLADNIGHVFAPFEIELWIALGIVVLVVASVNIWLSTTRGVHSYMSKRIRGPAWTRAGLRHKTRVVAGMMLDSLMVFSTYFFGHSVELDWQSTRAQKVLMFGFAFLILIAVASYTANLAAFLTVTGVSNYISSMEEAIYTNTPICAHPQLRNELVSIWPAATFVFNSELANTGGVLKDYQEGRCRVIASSLLEVRQSMEYMQAFCENELVSTGALVLENPIAFPVNADYSGGLSYWLFLAEKRGIDLQSFIDGGVPPQACNLKLSLSDTETELASLSVENFALPFILCAVCTILSIGLHLFFNQAKYNGMSEDSRNTVEAAYANRLSRGTALSQNPIINVRVEEEEEGEDQAEEGNDLYMEQVPHVKHSGVGGTRDQSIVETNQTHLGLVRRRVPNNHDNTFDPVEVQKQLQEVLKTQEQMMALLQQAQQQQRRQQQQETEAREEAPPMPNGVAPRPSNSSQSDGMNRGASTHSALSM